MRQIATLLATAWLLAATATPARAEFRTFRLDPEHMSIAFMVQHLNFADVLGLFTEVEGSFAFDETAPAVKDVAIVVRTASIFTNHRARDRHLRSADFLDVASHPTIVFVGREATPTGPRTGTITGDLTLLGRTRPITLDLELRGTGRYPFDPTGQGEPPYVVGVSARGTLDRRDFGMTYALEPPLVGDEVDLILEFEAIRQD
jgi:polyisoprenoid-binding protein YceI